jgi:N6-adenosine-specific RNA methylase IME4
MTDWAFAPLPPLSFDLIFADPPWSFKLYSAKGERKSAQAQYHCMDLDTIKALPVATLASPNAVLLLWATAPMLQEGLDTMRAWGFTYKSMGVWHKRTINGCTAFGTGYRLRSACEPFLLGVIGKPQTSRSHRNLIEGLARTHSRKPDAAYEWGETYMPGARRADLFARQVRPGWHAWGDQKDLYNAVA